MSRTKMRVSLLLLRDVLQNQCFENFSKALAKWL